MILKKSIEKEKIFPELSHKKEKFDFKPKKFVKKQYLKKKFDKTYRFFEIYLL
ncbi:MAG: hypothetical protein J6D11_00415 [Clostridia bacterium]|nr:hypothetical protein [Clostridia bacterium]